MLYAAIILSAGLSSRMRELKPLLDIGGKPALFRLLDTIRSSGIEKIIVVTGFERESLEAAIRQYGDPKIISLYNADFESGMFSSVKAGIGMISDEAGAALLFPADVPLVSAKTIRGLIASCEQGGTFCFAVPAYKGKNGHPLLVPREYFSEILEHTCDGGLKEVRNRHLAEMLRYETDDEGCVLDMDTPEDYEKLLAYEKRQDERE